MYRKSRIASIAGCLALALGVLICSEPLVTMAQVYTPPRRGIPKRREGAGTRGACLRGDRLLTSLIPDDGFGTTVSEQPTFFWYVPPKAPDAPPEAAKSANFRLLDKDENEIYSTTFPLSGFSGIVSFTLPVDKNLDVGKEYTWQFSVICDADNPSKNPFVEGVVQRVKPDDLLSVKIQRSLPRDRPSVYAASGIWYDSLTSLANLRCVSPSDFALTISWSTLLRSVELNDFAGESISQYCTQVSSSQSNSSHAGILQADPKELPGN